MSKKMLINASHPEENRVAIVVDGILSELDIELADQEQTRGNIYKAVVVRVETGLQAAFVDYGTEKLGFLQLSEIHPDLYPAKEQPKGRPRIADILRRGQEILIQIVKEERGNKGAALTTFLSLPGRYMVLMPNSTTKGVSRKIIDETQRKTLKKTMAELNLPEQMGYIVRTAGIGKEKDELKRDFDYLVRLYQGIVQRVEQVKAPAQLYQESNLAIRSIRDYFSTDMDEVLVDDENIYNDTKDFFSLVMPELSHLVKRHRERRPIFSRYQIEEQIDQLSKKQIPLSSGGSIVIDPTEALVAIDVNSGKMAGESGIEATALKTNLEAAAEIGRQLRLRDLGGLIVIDFIDMRDRKHNREVEQELRRALKQDKARVSVGKISPFGLLEMSRQRIKAVLSVGSYRECPHCHGLGKTKSVEAQSVGFLRQAHTAAAKGQIGTIEARVPYDVANYLLNQKRETINQLERQLGLKVVILGQINLLPGDLLLETFKREKETDETRKSAPISHANQIEMALAEARLEQEHSEPVAEPIDVDEEPETGLMETELATATPLPEVTEQPAATKKKRRRRRKKSATATETVATEMPAEQGTPTASPDHPDEDPSIQPQEAMKIGPDSPQTPAAADSEDHARAATKPKRRSRRNRKSTDKNRSTANNAMPVAASTVPEQVDETVETAPVAPPTTEAEIKSDAPPKRPQRKARKKTPKPPTTPSSSPEQTTAEAGSSAQPQERPIVGEAVEAEPGPELKETPQRRSRRPRKKPAEKAVKASVATEQAADGAESASTATPGKTAQKPKTGANRSRKKATTPSNAATTPADPGDI